MLRLLIVDDEEIIRESIAEMVDYRTLGYTLLGTARNGMEAYDMICDEYPDVVITDIRMPILSGLELIERTVKADSRIQFILLSGYSEFEYAKQAMRYGVRHYLLKPTDQQELIDALLCVREERLEEEKKREADRASLLASLRFPLEQSFLMEGLDGLSRFSLVFRKYQPLLSIPAQGLCGCVCSFVEQEYLKSFAADAARFLSRIDIPLCFPLIYVKNNAVLILQMSSLAKRSRFEEFLSQLHYAGQSVDFQFSFLHEETSTGLFLRILEKIARFEQITLLDGNGNERTISNSAALPSQVNQIYDAVCGQTDTGQVFRLLDSLFVRNMSLDAARSIAMEVFLKLNPVREEQPLDAACDFFRKLYRCAGIDAVKELLKVILNGKSPRASAEKHNTTIESIKAYVWEHYNDENLTLKWLAENVLFVSVGYLSKLFVREEGIRFSDFLNRVRMEEAQNLMCYYHSGSINEIACRVGFGNNPQYFRQVFKKYYHCTPSDYLKSLPDGSAPSSLF